MNIFATSTDPKKCAEALDDLRLNKMITETSQMLSVIVGSKLTPITPVFSSEWFQHYDEICIENGLHLIAMEKVTGNNSHVAAFKAIFNHPCTQWAMKVRNNAFWLALHLQHMINEWYVRKNKWHAGTLKSSIVYELVLLRSTSWWFEVKYTTPFVECLGKIDLDFDTCGSTVEKYRKYLSYQWINGKSTPKWTNSNPPEWHKSQ